MAHFGNITYLWNLLPKGLRQDKQSSVRSTDVLAGLELGRPGTVIKGTVTRALAGTYSVTVKPQGAGSEFTCIPIVQASDALFGVSQAYLPPEGSQVLVYRTEAGANQGFILGVIPAPLTLMRGTAILPGHKATVIKDLRQAGS